jgi:hypothetical protein
VHSILILTLSTIFLWQGNAAAQGTTKSDRPVVQLSGIVGGQLIGTIPFATVKVKGSLRGTIAGLDGFYSIALQERDTVEFSAVGFRKLRFVVPQGVSDQKLTYSPTLARDTVELPPVVISPWPTKEHFRQAFLNLKLQDDYSAIARKNLDPATLQQLMATMELDGGEQQTLVMQQIANAYQYSGGQHNYFTMGNTPVPLSLLNPFAWAQLYKAIKEGKFKKKEKK